MTGHSATDTFRRTRRALEKVDNAEDRAARAYCAARAEILQAAQPGSRARRDPLADYVRLSFQALAKNFKVLLETCYPPIEFWLDLLKTMPLERAARGFNSHGFNYRPTDNPAVNQALDKHLRPPAPISKKERIRGRDLFYRIISRQEYYPLKAEHDIIEQNLGEYCNLMKNANVVELCIGDGEKARKVLHLVLERQAINAAVEKGLETLPETKTVKKGRANEVKAERPIKYYANDIEVANLRRAKIKLCKDVIFSRFFKNLMVEPLKLSQVRLMPGDIFDERFWQRPEFDALRRSPHPTVVFLHGVTFNNFSPRKMKWLLRKFKTEFKSGTKFLVTVDHTTDVPTLERAYPEIFRKWLKQGFIFALRAAGADIRSIDVEAIDCRLRYVRRHGNVVMKARYTSKYPQKLRIPMSPEKQSSPIATPQSEDREARSVYLGLPKKTKETTLITKLGEENAMAMIREAGHQICKCMPYRNEKTHVNAWIFTNSPSLAA